MPSSCFWSFSFLGGLGLVADAHRGLGPLGAAACRFQIHVAGVASLCPMGFVVVLSDISKARSRTACSCKGLRCEVWSRAYNHCRRCARRLGEVSIVARMALPSAIVATLGDHVDVVGEACRLGAGGRG